MVDAQDWLRATLAARGIAEDAEVADTLGRDAAPAMSLRPLPAQGDDFIVKGELGEGGMGTVYLAEQRALGRDVALKRLRDDSPSARRSLLREAMITGRLEHPNIVPIHAVVDDTKGPGVVMKRVSGTAWRSLIDEGQTSLDRHLEIFLHVCNATAFAHSREVIHRDIKPDNVMIGEFGEVYLLDWGIAKRFDDEATDTIAGTPAYIAPEMVRGEASARTDVFLLGATLHEAVTGEPRHVGSGALAVLTAALGVSVYDYGQEVSPGLAAILNRACARDPADRFDGVAQLADAIREHRTHRASEALRVAADARFDELRDMGSADYSRVQQVFGACRFAYERAIELWPGGQAGAGRTRCLEHMIRYELGAGHAASAASILAALPEASDELKRDVAAARAKADEAQVRLASLERDQDPAVGARDRARAFRRFALAVLLLTMTLASVSSREPEFMPTTGRLVIVGAGVFVLLAAVLTIWRRRGEWNLVNQRIAQLSLGTLGVSALSRGAGYLADLPASSVLTTDAFLLGLGALGLSVFHRTGPALAALAFGVGLTGALLPHLIDDLFIVLSVVVPAVVLVTGRLGLRAPRSSRVRSENRAE